jgi:hypothetical protein
MSTHLEHDTDIWIVTGSPHCNVHGCFDDAVIIAAGPDAHRFCARHTSQAATAALHATDFRGWWRITSSHPQDGDLLLTVHPL